MFVLVGQTEAVTPCRSRDPELWFAEEVPAVLAAQELCRTCPLQAACLAGAIERREPCGVWGGELFERGRIVARKRPKGRPRKDAVTAEQQARSALADRLAEVADALPDAEAAAIGRLLAGESVTRVA